MASDRSGFAARYRSSRQRLQFQRHMFNHMTKPCPLLHPPQEASRLGIAAAVPGKAGKELHKRSGESIKPACRPILQRSEIDLDADHRPRSEEHTSELQSLMRNTYAVFCLKKKKNN